MLAAYRRAEAVRLTRHCGPEKKIDIRPVQLVTVTVPRLVSCIDEVQAFADGFLQRWNKRFAVAPRQTEDAHRPWSGSKADLAEALARREERILSKALTFSAGATRYAVGTQGPGTALRGAKVTLLHMLDGTLRVRFKNLGLEPLVLQRLAHRRAIHHALVMSAEIGGQFDVEAGFGPVGGVEERRIGERKVADDPVLVGKRLVDQGERLSVGPPLHPSICPRRSPRLPDHAGRLPRSSERPAARRWAVRVRLNPRNRSHRVGGAR
jgi:hypothetical protein